MGHYHVCVPCKQCGEKLGNPDRVRRSVWQHLLFPHGARFRCPVCGKIQFVANLRRHMRKTLS